MNRYGVKGSPTSSLSRLRTSYEIYSSETNGFALNEQGQLRANTSANAMTNYYSQRKEALKNAPAKPKSRLITHSNSLNANAIGFEAFLNLGCQSKPLISSKNELSGLSSKQSMFHKPNASSMRSKLNELERKHKEKLDEMSQSKQQAKENEVMINKLYFDNTQLTKVNQLLLDELDKHKEELSLSQLKYEQAIKDNHSLLKEIEAMKLKRQSSPLRKHKRKEADEESAFSQKQKAVIDNYKRHNEKCKAMIRHLEETIEKLVKDSLEISDHSIEPSVSSQTGNPSKRKREEAMTALEHENETLRNFIKELENKLALAGDRVKEQGSINKEVIQDNAQFKALEEEDNERKVAMKFYCLFEHLCHLLKRDSMPYISCLTRQGELEALIDDIKDEIQMLFIKKHYADDT